MNQKIAIVGAGMAGLMVARSLTDCGHSVVVFEKARGPGGRMSTRRQEEYAFDHGAQYFTCRDQRFSDQVEVWREEGIVAEWASPIQVLRSGQLSTTQEQRERYVGVPRMSSIARRLSQDLELVTKTRVGEVIRDEKRGIPWEIRSESGDRLGHFDAVIVATPAPQAVPLLAAVPDFAQIASGVSMEPCHATMVSFDSELEVDFGGAFVHDSILAWVARNSTKPNRPVAESWVLHSQSEWSAKQSEGNPEKVSAEMLQAFSEALGHPLPEVLFQSSHRWLLARSEKPLGEGFLWNSASRLGVCGDWLHGDRVEGAFLSGLELTEAIQQSLG